ncbi:hypothetical protein [Neptuniibacter sp. QD37_11]|uniref:hypothetical protein n=1 Tax=Neptuniibacter sp. QD37_11 TaxID=3398209 RepID=UPI0039F482C5
MRRSYEKVCDGCGAELRITDSGVDEWVVYDVETDQLHLCNTQPTNDDGPLTVRTNCWFCDADVFFFRDKNGGIALFDNLGAPWPKHPCWNNYSKYQEIYKRKLYKTLQKNNLSRRKGSYDFIKSGISIKKPCTTIRLVSEDHKALDKAVSNIVNLINAIKIKNIHAIPLPVRVHTVNTKGVKLHNRVINLVHSFSSNDENKLLLLMRGLQTFNIPNVVGVTIETEYT